MELMPNTGPLALSDGRFQAAPVLVLNVTATTGKVGAALVLGVSQPPTLSDDQAIELLDNPPLRKSPDEIGVYGVDFREELLPGETIERVDQVVVERVRMSTLGVQAVMQGQASVMGPPQVIAGGVFAFVGGGTPGVNYLLAVKVRTSEARVLQGEAAIRVRNQIRRG